MSQVKMPGQCRRKVKTSAFVQTENFRLRHEMGPDFSVRLFLAHTRTLSRDPVGGARNARDGARPPRAVWAATATCALPTGISRFAGTGSSHFAATDARSADSDLCPAVSAVRKLCPDKRIVACFPPGRVSKELASVVSARYTIGCGKLKDSQFPDVIETAGGFMLHKPASWDDPEYQKPH